MKKIAPILLAMVLALTLCLVGFADAESYDDDPLEETAALLSLLRTANRKSLSPIRQATPPR